MDDSVSDDGGDVTGEREMLLETRSDRGPVGVSVGVE